MGALQFAAGDGGLAFDFADVETPPPFQGLGEGLDGGRRSGLIGRLGHVVGVSEALFQRCPVHDLGQLVLLKADHAQVVTGILERAEFDRQQLVIPVREIPRGIVGQA